MKTNLPNLSERDYTRIPTLVVAMPDRAFAEMISEWQFNCSFRTLAILEDCSSIINRIKSLKPDFLFIDSEMQNINGFELAEKLNHLKLTTKIIMYASKRISNYLGKFLESSNQTIRGFIHKGCGIEEIEHCMTEVFSGRKYLSTCVNSYLNEEVSEKSNFVIDSSKLASLSKREKDVWDLLTEGKTESEIGEKLFIGLATVKTYKKGIKDTLGILGKGKLTHIALKCSIN
jgi:DNA-binding NarL/FixJ family response regulator